MRTIVGLFDTLEHARSVVRDLEASGFHSDQVSVVAHEQALTHGKLDATATGAGVAIGAGFGMLAGLAVVAVPGVGAVAAIGPILAGGLMGAVAGGLVGSLVDAGVPAEQAEYYTEGVRRGGTLVTLAVSDDDAPRAIEILSRHDPVDLNERALQWRREGWTPGASGSQTLRSTSSAAVAPDEPDPMGNTTMGDAAAEMPAPTLESHSLSDRRRDTPSMPSHL